MGYSEVLKKIFAALTMLILGSICFTRMGVINMHTVVSSAMLIVPAVVIMGYLGQRMGQIMDNPKNRADADYKIAVLNALKKMDKSITLEELNKKLTKQVEEPDLPDEADDIDE